MQVSTQWLKDYVSFKGSAENLAQTLTMAGLEVKGIEQPADSSDRVFEIEITSNRPDWLSHVGVAREVCALQNIPLRYPPADLKSSRDSKKDVRVELADPKLCPYYSCVLLEGVEFGESPDFIQQRLKAVGMRPINLVVDVTNYVLMELGQPLHAFDWNRLNQGTIQVRRAREKEKIKAINGSEYDLDTNDLLITDGRHPIALAGVMGGQESEVGANTRNILLESAYFAPAPVRRTSKKLNLTSESSYRFERGVDPRGVDAGRDRAVYLICKHARKVGRIGPVCKAGKLPVKEPVVNFPLSEIKRVLGTGIPDGKVKSYLKHLGLAVRVKSKGVLSVGVPSFRPDLLRPVDLVEEVARLHGFENIPETPLSLRPAYTGENPSLKIQSLVRQTALGAGLNEVITFSLISEKVFEKMGMDLSRATRIVNPQNKELTLMRPTLVPSLLEVVKTNFFHASGTDVRIFEIAAVYGQEEKGSLPAEEVSLGLAIAGFEPPHWLDKGRKCSFFDLKGILEQIFLSLGIRRYDFPASGQAFLEESCAIVVEGQKIGFLGKISQPVRGFYDIPADVFAGELNLTRLLPFVSFDRRFIELPKYPSSRRDIAVVVNEDLKARDVVESILPLHKDWIRKVEVVDVYRGGQVPADKKSLALAIEYRADDHTLTSEEINRLHSQVIDTVTRQFNAALRS